MQSQASLLLLLNLHPGSLVEMEEDVASSDHDHVGDDDNGAISSSSVMSAHADDHERVDVAIAAASSVVPPSGGADVDQESTNDTGQNDGERSPSADISNSNETTTDKLNREIALSNIHRKELTAHWRKVLSNEKYKELHNEIPTLSQHHDDNVKRKKDVITYILAEINSLRELYQDAMVSNMNRMEDLIAIHHEQIEKLDRAFRERVTSLQSTFREDVKRINAQYSEEKEAVRVCIQRQVEKDEAQIKALRQEHQHDLEDIRNRNLEHVNGLRFVMDSRVEELEEQFEQTHGEFAQNTDGTQSAYEQLKAKDDATRREIASKMRRANQIQREIQRFQLIAKQEEARVRDRHDELLARKSRAISRWNAMQEEMTKFRDGRQQQLLEMIKRANQRKEALQHQCLLADRVKKIAVSCQKMESSREKFASLLREPSCTADDQAEAEETNDGREQSSRAYIVGCMGRLGDNTHHFWNKFNMAKLDVLMLERKVLGLKKNEEDLRKKLKCYTDGITVNDDVLKGRNPLFVINGRMNAGHENAKKLSQGKRRTRKRLTVVDGNHFFAVNNVAQVR